MLCSMLTGALILDERMCLCLESTSFLSYQWHSRGQTSFHLSTVIFPFQTTAILQTVGIIPGDFVNCFSFPKWLMRFENFCFHSKLGGWGLASNKDITQVEQRRLYFIHVLQQSVNFPEVYFFFFRVQHTVRSSSRPLTWNNYTFGECFS